MLKALQSLYSRNTKTVFLLFSVAILFFLDFDTSLAMEEATTAQKATITINSIYKILAWIMGILTAFVSLFLQPEWVNGTAIDLDRYMKEIWTFVSNVVYFIFAFLLVFIAFVNIIGKWGEKFGLKQALPKFVVGILIVPFTWFFVQFMISLAWVLTVWALTLPYEMFKDRAEDFPVYALAEQEGWDKSLAEATICTKYAIHFWETPPPTWNVSGAGPDQVRQAIDAGRDPIYCKEDGRIRIIDILSWEAEGDDGTSSVYSIVSLYTFGLLGFENLDNFEAANATEWFVTTLVSLVWKLWVWLLFLLVYFVLLIALFFALFIRIVRLWIYIMLSPVFGLMYFLWSKGEGVMAKFNFKEFIALCMVPVYVSLALSFGFMFMLVASSGLKPTAVVESDKVVPLKIGIIEIELTWSIFETGAWNAEGLEENLMAKLFSFKGLGWGLGEIIVMLFGIGVFWIAVMAALKSSEITKAVVQPISDFWSQVWKLAASAPMYAPIIPTGKWFTSAAAIWEVKDRWIAQFKNYRHKWADDLSSQFGLPWSEASKVSSASRSANTIVESRNSLDPEYVKALKEATFAANSTNVLANSPEYIKLLTKALKDAGITDQTVTQWDRNSVAKALNEIDKYLDGGKNEKWNLLWVNSRGVPNLDINELDKILVWKQRWGDEVWVDQSADQAKNKILKWITISNINNINTTSNNIEETKEKIRSSGEFKELLLKMNGKVTEAEFEETKIALMTKLKPEIEDIFLEELRGAVVFKWEDTST